MSVQQVAPASLPSAKRRSTAYALTLMATVALVACGSGGNEEAAAPTPPPPPPPPAPTRLVGVAAVGAPMAGAAITVIDADAATADASATAGADGSYSVDVSSLRAPFFVRASANVNGESVVHTAVVATATANADNTANVTPFTSAITALVAPGGDPAALGTAAALTANATATQVGNATSLLVNTLRSDAGTAALLPANFNPTTTTFAANGTGADAALTRIDVAVANGSVALTNNAATATANGVPAGVTLTPALVATPNAAPTLAASAAAGDLPTQADIDAIGAKLQACFALPVAQRVTQDAQGNATNVLGACNFAPADWRSNGQNFVDNFGQGTLTLSQFNGTRVGAGSIVLAQPAENLTDPKEYKHPYCNTAACVIVRFPLTFASGKASASEWYMGKVNGAWNVVGNQRPLSFGPEARLVRTQPLNAAATSGDSYSNADKIESVIRLNIDPGVGSNNDLRAVRVTGPGLPAAGVVMQRSQRCATDDRFAITRQDGITRLASATPATANQWWWTTTAGTAFVLGAATANGAALTLPVASVTSTAVSNPEFSQVAVSSSGPMAHIAAITAWSRYKFEFFYFSTNTDTPDAIGYARIGSAPEQPRATGITWPAIDPAFLSARVSPTGSKAAAQTSFVDTMTWTIPPTLGLYVSSGYWFGQNNGSATNSEGETANFNARGRIDYRPAAYGDTTGAGYGMADPRSGASMSTFTASNGTNPNPRCGVQALPAFTTSTSDYREAGLTFRAADRQVRQVISFWRN